MKNVNIIPCNYNAAEERKAVAELINMYINDEMGGGESLSEEAQRRLTDELERRPYAIAYLARVGEEYAGVTIGFENLSTFTVKPMINVHDVYVRPEYRGMGVGRRLLEAMVDEGRRRGCSRITLEVRVDNTAAQGLYRRMGFVACEPDMYYWRKYV